MKTTKIFTIAAMALMISACSSNDIEETVQQPSNRAEGIPFTATISIGESATTRALTESGSNIVPSWAEGDKVALIHNDVIDEMEVQSVSNGLATLTGTLTGSPANDDAVTIIYPSSAADGTTGNVKADLLAAQDGTLATIAEKYDVRKGAGTLNVGATATLYGNVSLTNQFAIFKLTLKDIDGINDISATSVVISNHTGVVTTVTPASGCDKMMYVALPTTATTLKFLITGSDSKKYFNMFSSLTLGTNFYQSTVKLATVGNVIASDGKCYKSSADIPSGNTGVAMIAYLGNESDCTNGLALQLNDSPVSKTWTHDAAKNYAEGLDAVPGGTWRLPSKDDWQNMFLACRKDGDASSANDTMNPIQGFKEKIAVTGITWQTGIYWSSSPAIGTFACEVNFHLDGSNLVADFDMNFQAYVHFVLGCLAF